MYKKLLAQCIGIYLLMFVGNGAVIVNSLTQSLTPVRILLTFGLVVMVLIDTFSCPEKFYLF